MKKLLKAIGMAALVVMSGCVATPKTTFEIPTARGVIRWTAPTDKEIEGLYVDFTTGMIMVDRYGARMNPEVIAQSAAGQVAQMRETFQLFRDLGLIGANTFSGRAPGEGFGGAPQQTPEAGVLPQQPQQQMFVVPLSQLNQLMGGRGAITQNTNSPAQP